MATGSVFFDAATYAPGGDEGDRALVTVTQWAGALPIEGATDHFFDVLEGADLTVTLEETTGAFCYRFVVETPHNLGEEVRYVTLAAGGPFAYADLVDVDPTTFTPTTVTPTLTEYILQLIADNPTEVDPVQLADAIEAYLLANPPAGAPDATTLVNGLIRLAGDLGGTAAAPTVPGLAGKAALAHSHAQADVTGLATDLAGKAALVHAHAIADVTNLAATLAALATLASPAFTGTPTAPTAAPGTNTTQLATTAFVAALGALKANLASPTFTGTPTAPTAAPGTNTTQLATTAFVDVVRAALASSKADVGHAHAIADVTGLQAALDAGANVGIPTYFSSSEPAPAGPLLWIKDLGGNAVSLAIKKP